CRARGALRFDDGLFHQPLVDEPAVYAHCAFRRFLTDGRCVSRLEIGIATRPRPLRGSLDARALEQLILKVFDLRVRVPGASAESNPLSQSSGRVAAHYLASTTRHVDGSPGPTEQWWLSSGVPMLLVEYSEFEVTALPRYVRGIQEFQAE